MLVGLLGLLLGFFFLPQLLLLVLEDLEVLLGTSRRLVTVLSGGKGRILSELLSLLLGLLLLLFSLGSIGNGVGVRSLIFTVESRVRTLFTLLESLPGLSVT